MARSFFCRHVWIPDRWLFNRKPTTSFCCLPWSAFFYWFHYKTTLKGSETVDRKQRARSVRCSIGSGSGILLATFTFRTCYKTFISRKINVRICSKKSLLKNFPTKRKRAGWGMRPNPNPKSLGQPSPLDHLPESRLSHSQLGRLYD